MKILAIETSTDVCGVTIIADNKVICIKEEVLFRNHAEKLPLFTREVLAKTSLKINDLNGIAVSNGPGSFTGLRIGLSFAKALAFSNDIDLIPIPTLYSMVKTISLEKSKIKILLFSHSQNLYLQDFNIINFKVNELSKPKLVEWNDKILTSSKDYQLFHYGCEKLFKSQLISTVKPSSKIIASIAMNEYEKFALKNYSSLQPNYVSAFNIGKKKFTKLD